MTYTTAGFHSEAREIHPVGPSQGGDCDLCTLASLCFQCKACDCQECVEGDCLLCQAA
jgi:hypothetical protein